MIANTVATIGNHCLDFLSWFDNCESLWKLLLIPLCVIVYAVMILCDAVGMVLDHIEEFYDS